MNHFVKTISILSFASISVVGYADVEEVIEKSFSLGDSPSISLTNINGNVKVSHCNCSDINVTATITADDQATRDLISVDMSTSGTQLRIKTEFESKGWSGHSGKRKVDYELSVPNDTDIRDFDLVNGDLSIEGLTGELNVSLVNGDLESISSHNEINVDTVNGQINIAVNNVSELEAIEIQSVNGRVNLTLPSDINADVEATTVNGSIKNDFGLTVNKGRYVGRSMQGTIGNGGMSIDLSNVNGAIYLKR